TTGRVSGVDVSAEMLRQASRRNRAAVRAGQVELALSGASDLPFDAAAFDAVYSTNSAQFWPDLELGMREVFRVLASGGRAVIVVQPMWRGATETDSRLWQEKLGRALELAGLTLVESRLRHARGAPAAAVSATKP
ncbi:MAG TPA: class I SAM-dependent methyltransferase, partial [Polyangiaceae bacterium]|nr:class I SAM-dependent methyltransferase [Polyangiaceae bacterium]